MLSKINEISISIFSWSDNISLINGQSKNGPFKIDHISVLKNDTGSLLNPSNITTHRNEENVRDRECMASEADKKLVCVSLLAKEQDKRVAFHKSSRSV